MRLLVVVVVLVSALAGCSPKDPTPRVLEREGQPDVILHEHQAEMAAAIQKAQDSLDVFLERLAKGDGDYFAVKVRFPTPDGGGEHIWVEDLEWRDGKFHGVLGNEPVGLPGKKLGDRVTASRSEVSDWLIRKGDSMEGLFTNEVLSRNRGSQ